MIGNRDFASYNCVVLSFGQLRETPAPVRKRKRIQRSGLVEYRRGAGVASRFENELDLLAKRAGRGQLWNLVLIKKLYAYRFGTERRSTAD